MAELADAGDLKSSSHQGVRVRAPLRAPSEEPLPAPPDDASVPTLLSQLMRRAARRGRREVARVADAGRQQLEMRQARSDLDAFWVRLGKTAYHLAQAGEIEHPAIDRACTRIDELTAHIDALEAAGAPVEPSEE